MNPTRPLSDDRLGGTVQPLCGAPFTPTDAAAEDAFGDSPQLHAPQHPPQWRSTLSSQSRRGHELSDPGPRSGRYAVGGVGMPSGDMVVGGELLGWTTFGTSAGPAGSCPVLPGTIGLTLIGAQAGKPGRSTAVTFTDWAMPGGATKNAGYAGGHAADTPMGMSVPLTIEEAVCPASSVTRGAWMRRCEHPRSH